MTSREATDAIKAEHGAQTTPQTFINGERIGGYDDLRRYLGKTVADPKTTTYKPVIALFSMTALMALAVSYATYGDPFTVSAVAWFPRLQHGRASAPQAPERRELRQHVPQLRPAGAAMGAYSYIYPFAEGMAGVLMIAGALTWLSVPISLFIGTLGAVSMFKAVYIDKRELKCACVSESSNAALGFASLTESPFENSPMAQHLAHRIGRSPCMLG